LVGHGHGAIRATHDKTLELSPDPDITERATCIIAVDTAADEATRRLAGPIRITVAADGESFTFEALANPAWQPGGPAIVRRSAVRLPGTLATEATASAADLPRPLVAALRDPAARVEVTLDPIPGRPAAVLVALDPHAPADPRVAAELAVADVIAAEDELAAELLGERVAAGPLPVIGRTVVAAVRDLPGATVARDLRNVPVDTLGLPPALAVAAASPSRGPLVVAPDGSDARAALRSTPAASRLVVPTTADQVGGLLEAAAERRGVSGAVVLPDRARPRRIEAGASLPGRGPVHLCFDAATESGALDPTVKAAVDGLLADGVPTKTAANALATLAGWDRRRAYDAILNWSGR
jgi:hypothetical protein